MNRLELTPEKADATARYKKIVYRQEALDELLVDLFLDSFPQPPPRLELDLDATDDPVHGNQEGRFFRGYYREYCYLPLYIICDEFVLCARLRRSNTFTIMSWCEENGVEFLFGLAKNKRLLKIIGKQLQEAKVQFEETKKAARVFTEFSYQTRQSWKRERRVVVAKAEHLEKGANPRFVVTSLSAEKMEARALYEELYCARGEMR